MRVCGNCEGLALFSQFKGRCMAKETRDEVQSDGSRKVKYRAIVRHIEDSAEACLRYRQCRHIVFPQKRYSD